VRRDSENIKKTPVSNLKKKKRKTFDRAENEREKRRGENDTVSSSEMNGKEREKYDRTSRNVQKRTKQ
jgi:hypothetical protein